MEIAKYETIDVQTAAKLATVYVGSFANQPHNADVILRQVREWCLGKPANVLRFMCDPNSGAVSRSDKPCLQALNRWYEDWTGQHAAPKAIPDFKPEPEEMEEPPEVRQAAIERWQKIRGGVVKSNCVGRPKGWKPIQKQHSLDELNARMERT